jgi:CDP-paratose 2-epimerase
MKVVITGGAGFIGSNAALRHMRRGNDVVVIDDLSRRGAERNMDWLSSEGRVTLCALDIRDSQRVARVFRQHADAGLVLHLAGQVAVTTSVTNPRADFEANALGTFNVLEAARVAGIDAPFIYSSTNKVYGGMDDVAVVERGGRYAYADLPAGVSEERALDFHSPYGCSKGTADQYIMDYTRTFPIPMVVFRMSCIYGPHQFGTEDQGWVAHFLIRAIEGQPITLYGNGMQVRDILFVDDLLDAFDLAAERIDRVAGRVYNIGGGPENAISLLDLVSYLECRTSRPVAYRQEDWRPGDQKIFVSNIARARRELGWAPQICSGQGLDLLYDWISANKELFQ